VDAPELGQGRDPQLYYAQAKRFLDGARESGRPFFLMANSHDPHRPFAGSLQEQIRSRGKKKRRRKIAFPEASRYYKPEEVQVPGFLPDIPDVRKEVAQYFSSVHRCDMTAGAILRALRECGFQDNTLVLFLGDHGMAFPYAKTNCYRASTLSPWIVRWPGVVKPGTLDREHFVSGVDYMPTMLEAAGLAQVDGMDGHSFLPVLKGKRQDGRETVFTVFNKTSGKREYPMRAIQNKRFGYIFNAWSDGKTAFRNESQSGLTFNAMKLAAKNDKAIARRVDFFLHRVPEELYDYENDPSALTNLADRPEYGKQLKELRAGLLKEMEATSDPVLPAFRKYLAGRA